MFIIRSREYIDITLHVRDEAVRHKESDEAESRPVPLCVLSCSFLHSAVSALADGATLLSSHGYCGGWFALRLLWETKGYQLLYHWII